MNFFTATFCSCTHEISQHSLDIQDIDLTFIVFCNIQVRYAKEQQDQNPIFCDLYHISNKAIKRSGPQQ